MCGRFVMDEIVEAIESQFEVDQVVATTPPRYNIAPSQPVSVVVEGDQRYLDVFRWGLIPSWAKDPKIGNKLINARAETLAEKPSFRAAFRRRRCVIPTTGFFEWKRDGSQRTPMYIHLKECRLFSFAGLWEEWHTPEGSLIRSCTIITVAPNAFMESIHNRMPAILLPGQEGAWLNPSEIKPSDLQPLLQPYPGSDMTAHAVSSRVNSPSHDDASLVQPV